MRTAFCIAIGFAALVSAVPPSFAQSGGTGAEAEERQTHSKKGISLAVPIGKVSVGPKSLDGEPVYVRRTTVGAGMTIVEVSTTPFMPVLASNEGTPGVQPIVRPDQPAGW